MQENFGLIFRFLLDAATRETKIAARHFWSLNCRNYPHRGVILKEEKSPLLWVRDSLGGIQGDNLGEGNCESKIITRQWGDNFAARHQDVSQGHPGIQYGD